MGAVWLFFCDEASPKESLDRRSSLVTTGENIILSWGFELRRRLCYRGYQNYLCKVMYKTRGQSNSRQRITGKVSGRSRSRCMKFDGSGSVGDIVTQRSRLLVFPQGYDRDFGRHFVAQWR